MSLEKRDLVVNYGNKVSRRHGPIEQWADQQSTSHKVGYRGDEGNCPPLSDDR